MSYHMRGLGYAVDLWGFVPEPDDACPETHVMRNGKCMTAAEIGFNPDAAAQFYLDRCIDPNPGPNPVQGTRVRGVLGASASAPKPCGGGGQSAAQQAVSNAARNDALLQATIAGATNGSTGAGGAAIPAPAAPHVSVPSTSGGSALLSQAQGMPMWVWLAAAGAALFFFAGDK